MKISLAQINPTVGDISGNLKYLKDMLNRVSTHSPDLMIFPELFISGYPPWDLLERSAFIQELQNAVQEIKKKSRDYPHIGILIGCPIPTGKKQGKGLYNAVLLIRNGETIAQINKSLLPTYDVFDETRYFDPAPEIQIVPFKDEILGISICEDAWNDPELWRHPIYTLDPIEKLAEQGATILINVSASPFFLGKDQIRHRLIRNHVKRHQCPFIFINQVGGNDELVFDGSSFILNQNSDLVVQFPAFRTEWATIDLDRSSKIQAFKPLDQIGSLHDALVLGLHDYAKKCGFSQVLLGLSGGIDSAVACVLAARALGAERVWGIAMPSIYSSQGSIDDSKTIVNNLGIHFSIIPIRDMYQSYIKELKPHFHDQAPDITEENIQARIRGNILMALSNKFGHLVLATGNKSELAMGYCTLYGDMSGGLSILSDVPKTKVYELAQYINRKKEIIPQTILVKPPSAELRPDQKDLDSLPPYETLDAILDLYLNNGLPLSEIVKQGFDRETVFRVAKSVDQNEYKRRQSTPGLKVTTKAFGSGRRMPIAAKFSESWG